jgi:hypothetical protein
MFYFTVFLHRLKLYVYFFLDVADSYIQISTGFVQLATIENTQLDKYVITTIYRIYACKKKTHHSANYIQHYAGLVYDV